MGITRRGLLQAGAAVGAGMLLPTRFAPTAAGVGPSGVAAFTEPLPTLADLGVIDMTTAPAAAAGATLNVVNGRHRFHSSLGPADTFAFRTPGGAQEYLGPVIVARQDLPFDLTVHNRLGAHPLGFAVDEDLVPDETEDAESPRIATHLHGGNTSVHSDGGPHGTFLPGDSWTYNYRNTQEAAGLWYHDHAVGITRLNVYAGLASGYLIRNGDDPGDGSTGLPPAPYEVPLILQDRMLNPDGTLAYPANPNGRPWAAEFFGDVATVNGKAWPNLNVARGKYRFRIYNGSNARFYNLKLVNRAGNALVFFQIGTDGGLLDRPVKLNKLLLGPGERADVVVDFTGLSPGTVLTFTNSAPTPFPDGPVSVVHGGMPLRHIMRFTVTSRPGFRAPLPTQLRAVALTSLANARFTAPRFPVVKTRTMTMVEVLDPVEGPVRALLNNRLLHDTEHAAHPVRSNTLEQWELVNLTGDAHPIHLHFTQFQVLNRQRIDTGGYTAAAGYEFSPAGVLVEGSGSYPPPPVDPFLRGRPSRPALNERGWKDTVVAMPGEVTRIVVPFGPDAADGAPLAIGTAFTGEYVWHCHILEHEDNDMMQAYTIV